MSRRSGNGIPALDGVRAVAVGLVLAAHGGIPGVSGGFIGVDIFFVLSGFLITSLLLDEWGRDGRINLTGFWIRRARRLLPALVLMVLAVVALRALFPADAVAALRDDAIAAFFWVANWLFVAQHSDYFTQGAVPSPLQHTWSLGVEEQYYIVWPLLLFAVAALASRPRTLRRTVCALAGVGALASAAVAIVWVSDASMNRVYFGTDTRAQALLVGSAAAALLVRDWPALTGGATTIRSRWARWLTGALPIVGLAVLAVVAHYATGDVAEFRAGLLTVVAGAAVLVVAAVALNQHGPVARLLACPPLVWLGVISYGVYLWHWPVFLVLNGERTGWSGMSLFALRCAVTAALAASSWWLLEQPIRRWRPAHVPQVRLAAATAATAAAVTMLVVPITARPVDAPTSEVVSAAAVMPEVPIAVRSAPLTSGARTVAVVGDSVAWTMMRYLPPTPGFTFVDYTTIGCGIARGGPYRYSGATLSQKPDCDTWPDRWSQRIGSGRPDTVLLIIGRWEIVDRVHEGHWTHIGEPVYDAYLAGELNRALDVLSSTGAQVVATTVPYNRRGEQPDGGLYPEDEPDRVDDWNALLRRAAAKRPNVAVLDLNKKLNPAGRYTTKVNGIRTRSDGVHPTPEAVQWLTPWLLDGLVTTPARNALPGR